MNRTGHCKSAIFLTSQRNLRKFFGQRKSGNLGRSRLIGFQENELRSTINYRFVTDKNIGAQDSINARAAISPTTRKVAAGAGGKQCNQAAAKTHAAGGETPHERYGELLAINFG